MEAPWSCEPSASEASKFSQSQSDAALFYWYDTRKEDAPDTGNNSGLTAAQIASIGTFEECSVHFAVQESWPPRCSTPDGRTFAQDIGNELAKMDLITIDSPRPTATVSSPLTITGKARGTWYFEASFPIELQDSSGKVIAQHYAEAQGEWMTENFVPFKATLTYPAQPTGSRGKLILRKDNPSGLSQNDDSLIIPIVFK
jgi:hypothetical protein